MKSIVFIEFENGEIFFKCDTFWSKSKKPSSAKVYSNSDINHLKSILQSALSGSFLIDKDKIMLVNKMDCIKYINSYKNAKLGYFNPDDQKFENIYAIKDNITVSDLGNPTYLWKIAIKDISILNINQKDNQYLSYDLESIREFLDYKKEVRNDKINDIFQ